MLSQSPSKSIFLFRQVNTLLDFLKKNAILKKTGVIMTTLDTLLPDSPPTTQPLSYRWYIVHTTPKYERKVRERILDRARTQNLESSIGEIFIPTVEVLEVKNGKKKTVETRLYSGYLFIQLHMSDEVWHLIRKTSNVTSFVGGANARPTPIPESDIQIIRDRIAKTQDKPQPKVIFEKDTIVRIKNGPFKDFNGTIASADYDRGKLKLMVSVFGRETSVEVSFSDVEKNI